LTLSGACTRIIESVGVDPASHLGEALHFFIYDSVKILLLLYVMIAAVGFLRTYISQEKIRRALAGRGRLPSYLTASGFGALTPFCSCSSIPIFISFLKAGAPLGPAFAFLVTSPLINEYLAVLMLGFFGWKITTAYIAFGLMLGVVAGAVMDKLGLESEIVQDLTSGGGEEAAQEYKQLGSRIRFGLTEANSIVRKLWMWVLLGVGVGAAIHGFIPQETIEAAINKTGAFSVPIAAALGIPIYANCSAVVPIALVLFQKGVPLGTALTFMMSTAALSLPEAVILRRAMKIKLILLFFTIVGAGIILVGYVFNLLQPHLT